MYKYYQILGLSIDANRQQITQAHNTLKSDCPATNHKLLIAYNVLTGDKIPPIQLEKLINLMKQLIFKEDYSSYKFQDINAAAQLYLFCNKIIDIFKSHKADF